MVSVAADIMALVLLTAPGKQGADIVFGSAQRFGVPMGYGGPHAAFFAAKDEYKRSMPGRIIGVSKMRLAMPLCAWRCRLASNIFAVKANSNICTSSAAGKHRQPVPSYHGPVGRKLSLTASTV
ncbi:hypothetical protein MJ581_16795 [Escherichia coli]|nr:hypothetical protein MJ581_16795 [Escherichia coli]